MSTDIQFDVHFVQVLDDGTAGSETAAQAHGALWQYVCGHGRVPFGMAGTQWRGDVFVAENIHSRNRFLALQCKGPYAAMFHASEFPGLCVCDGASEPEADGRLRTYSVPQGRLATALACAVEQHVRWSPGRRLWMRAVLRRAK